MKRLICWVFGHRDEHARDLDIFRFLKEHITVKCTYCGSRLM